MAKITSKIPALNNLKQCLQFLEWLKNDEHMQGQVAEELARRLRIYYSKNSDSQNIKTALSRLLFQVSHFYDKLCKNAQPTNYMANTPSVVLFTLLACIPKLLSVVYFLQYHVDKRFVAVGGGDWADQTIGMVAMSTSGVSKIDTYLIDTSFVKYGVISGGFEKGRLKEGSDGGYTYGTEMVDDLPKLLGELHTNFFSDVLVTSALTNAGSQASNTANALALLKTFCEIVDDDKDRKVENALDGYINEYRNCIEWEKLKTHCAELRVSLERIFNAGVLSNTGHSPAVDDLNKEKFAKRMTRWLRENLDRVGSSLKEIKANRYTNAGDYFNKHFFPYGFIFDSHDFGTESYRSQVLDQKWKGVVEILSEYGRELDKTVNILKGVSCKDHNHVKTADLEADDEEDEVVVLEELGVSDDLGVEGSPNQGKKAEGAQNQGKKAEGAQNQGKKAEGAQNQGKKAEGAQNQGKKAEGAQNQGKKAEGSPNQGKKAEGAQNQGKKAEGAQNQGKKAEGAQNQGKKAEAASDDDDEEDDLADAASVGSSNQNNGQSEHQPGMSHTSLGSNVPPEDGKGPQGHAGPPDDAGKSLQGSDPPAQAPALPQAPGVKPSSSSPGGHGAGGAPGAPGSNGDPGQTGPTSMVASASSQGSDAQGIQSPQPTLQSSPASFPTPPASPTGSPKLTAQAAVLGGGLQNASLGSQHTVSSQAVLTQAAKDSSRQSAASGSLAPGSGQGQDLPKLEVEILKPKLISSEDAYNSSADALISDHIERSRYRNGINPPKDPLTVSHTLGKASPQSDIASDLDKLQEASVLSNSLDLRDVDMPFEHFDFHESPNEGGTGEVYIPQCLNPWYVDPSSTSTRHSTTSPPDSDNMPSPNTVREMLYWMVGVVELGYIGFIQKHVGGVLDDINKDSSWPSFAIDVTGYPNQLTASRVTNTLAEACLYSANIITRIKYYNDFKAFSTFDFKSVYSQLHYSSDPSCLLCQLRDYAYACHYQLQFLKSQCSRNESRGGWKNCEYGSEAKMPSPLQAFLTDGWDSDFKTHLFDPCNLCLKSRVRMGFKRRDLPKISKQGSVISTILSPTCGGEDPLLTLSSYLNCLTRRTPRTTGELVSYFHHFGIELHDYASKALSSLGTAITKSHANCPNWDQLGDSDLQAVQGIRGYETLNSKHNHGNDHSNTLSTLVGCCSDSANCPQYCSPITYRAYSLYSPTFAHTYLSWAVYLPDRLWESLERLRYDFKTHTCSEPKSFHQCSAAMPLLYTHGFMPPEGKLQWPLTCSDIIVKLRTVVDGKPIAMLITCMDEFLYRVRGPFIYTLMALWSGAILFMSYTILYRLDVLYLCSHFIRSKASHLIDVKALLTNSRKMLSLYDADYFDDDPNDLIDQLK
ncbi:RIBOSOME BINDING PROTEIN-1, putative [Babesia bigemina]|uniref:RIBOSOME BINDING PROTEIN-1, putative n=1 Tax=Babesia bigemina TaxID=5866 RepID=A0A061D941_BABBI|nr:RIBOSOME BINDING PROTEIN-1, putative [Babesia bigemina]CDR97063.1 RIBOSOME BINDING PROTEIN-1, putative [Babesia bigemina]|eukprot:XP_012769249.1 RIBOSOME BINDING PROTEIN-1, putative [Babesia bigemina]